MSREDYQQRFKGVENFLRRIAFNLGNTPSQTEVKVVSCIPIDVTDLQQKIVHLEKQLEQRVAVGKVNSIESQREAPIVNTAICNTSCPKHSNAAISCKSIGCRLSRTSLHNQNCTAKQNRSSVSFVCPGGSNQTKDCFYSTEVSEMTYTKKRKPTECKRMFFNKRKVPKKAKIKTQLVYYAQTKEKNPFNNYFPADIRTKKRANVESIDFNRSYLTDMIREQYKHGPVNEGTNVSEFSTPICRDITYTPKIVPPQHYESDMCSCCRGQFQNIDNHKTKYNHLDIFSSQTDSKSVYYDANLYDVIPVKENAVKIKHFEVPKIKDPKNQMNMACWPENIRPKHKISPMIVNYSTVQTRQPLKKEPVIQTSRKEKELNKMSNKRHGAVNRKTITKLSNTGSVEYSEVYAKRIERTSRQIPKSKEPKIKDQNNAACLTTVIAECQTTSIANATSHEQKSEKNADIPLVEDKTKETLNQIKDILQSVLTEVKTNSKISKISSKKKDAIVQNGLSQSNIYGESSLLQSFTYSPYSMDPYGPSCSQQRHPSSLCYPNIQPSTAKCMQHYPLFVQPGRNNCTSSYGNNHQVNKSPTVRRAASTATNTEDLQIRSKETENLIKEIYKAMALNIEIPPTESALVNEHGDINQDYNTRTEDMEANHIAKAISEIFKNTNPMHSSITQNTATPFDSQQVSNEPSYRSQRTQNYAQSISKQSADVYSDYVNSEVTDNDETEQVLRELESDEESDVTIVNEVSESSVSETESEDDDVAIEVVEKYEKTRKRGLFSKMLKILMPKSRQKVNKNKGRKEEPSDYDSIDYRTLHRPRNTPAKHVQNIPSKSRAVVYYSKKPRTQSPVSLTRRSPYMEQEYRRYFDERLTFHDKQHPNSSTRESAPRKRPVYYQQVEARSALIDHFNQRNEYTPRTEAKFIKQNRNEETYTREFPVEKSIVPPKAISWLEKHKLGVSCGKQWKKLIIEG